MKKWVIYQVGSREHYALPRMFAAKGELKFLVTDYWFRPGRVLTFLLSKGGYKTQSRYHSELSDAKVYHWNLTFLLIDAVRKLPFLKNHINRDKISQLMFSQKLKKIKKRDDVVVFSYNYIANGIFKKAQKKGLECVLGQIDAGPKAGEINRMLFEQTYGDSIPPNPDMYLSYDSLWREECEIAKHVIVNSEWSKKMLLEAGIPEQKLKIIEIAYKTPLEAQSFARNYPTAFNKNRPLKVLYLGSLKLLKGIAPLLDAIRLLSNEPIEFYLVGSIQIPDFLLVNLPLTCHVIGSVNKARTNYYYRDCDIMVLPTYSDGFAMTQLEAQAWGMPIIATERCGKIVTDNVNGRIIKNIHSQEIANILRDILLNPQQLHSFKHNTVDMNRFSLETIYKQYQSLK